MSEIIIRRTDGSEIARGEYPSLLAAAQVHRANLMGADLVGANLRGADLVRADLMGADLVGADLVGADLVGANLRGADLMGANLRGANLMGADLGGADLMGANLRGAYLMGAMDLAASHDCAAEILRCAAKNDEQERWAAWPLLRRDWCWNVWLKKLVEAPDEIQTWVRSTLCVDPAWGFREKFEEAKS